MVLAPAVCTVLRLVNHDRTWDLYGRDGEQATLFRTLSTVGASVSGHLLYIRSRLIEQYLARTNSAFIWLPWGERNVKHDGLAPMASTMQDLLSRHLHIYRELYLWSETAGVRRVDAVPI
jgi:hypothetical protein